MRWRLYNVLFAIGYTLMLPRFFLRMWKRGGYRRGFLQRLGHYPPPLRQRLAERPRLWVHAVSVGEVGMARRFIDVYRHAEPHAAFVLSTTTSTGYRLAEQTLPPEDVLIYFPADFPTVVRRVLDRIRPTGLVLVEGELWPNLIRQAVARGIPVAIINGRLSDRSFRRYRWGKSFFRPVLESLHLIIAQSEKDRARYQELGARPERLRVLPSAKYDLTHADPKKTERARRILEIAGMGGPYRFLVGGSTWPGEEAALCRVCRTLRKQHPDLRLILVPRHAERRPEVEADIQRHGLSWVRRSTLTEPDAAPPASRPAVAPSPDVLLVDTTGELTAFYACASVVFVGKSLYAHGGQNIIEPAMLGKAIVVGPHLENFASVLSDFLSGDALVQVRNETELQDAIARLLEDHRMAEEYGQRARALVERRQGSMAETARLIAQTIQR